MGELPPLNTLVGNPTEAQFQGGLADLYNYLFQVVTSSPVELLDILDGVVTPLTSTYLQIDTENDTVSDFLDRISPENIGEKMIFVRIQANARSITLRHLVGGSGQLYLVGKTNITMDDDGMLIGFRYDAVNDRWVEQFRNWGIFSPTETSKTAARLALALGSAALLNTGTASGAIPLNSDLGALSKLNTINNSNQVSDGVLTAAKFANGPANGYIGFNGLGVPVAAPFPNLGKQWKCVVITETGEWEKPVGVIGAKVTAIGGGGGSGGATYYTDASEPVGNGYPGGETTFGDLVKASGGSGGPRNKASNGSALNPGASGVGTVGLLLSSVCALEYSTTAPQGLTPYGALPYGMGGARRPAYPRGEGYSGAYSGPGGPGGVAQAFVTFGSAASSVMVTIGAGGARGTASGRSNPGYVGFAGACIIEWFE